MNKDKPQASSSNSTSKVLAPECVVTFAQVRNINFNTLIEKLLNMAMPFEVAHALDAIAQAVSRVQFETDNEWQQISSLYLNQGVLKTDLDEETKFKGAQEINNFLIKRIKINVKPLPLFMVNAWGLTAKELILLEGLVA